MVLRAATALKLLGLLGLVVLFVVALTLGDLSDMLKAESIESWLGSAGFFAPLAFMLVMAAAVVISPIPSLPLDIVAGKLFGPVPGAFYAAVGATLGAIISFQIARALGRDLLARFLKGHINFCRGCSDKLLTKVVFLSRLIPFVSFDLVSYGAGFTRMSPLRFTLATFLGMLPLTLLYTTYGALALEHRLFTWIGGLLMVILFFLLPRWIERYDLLSMRRFFEHPVEDPKAPGKTDSPAD